MPIDHDPAPSIADMPFGHQVLIPGRELAGVGRTGGGAFSPDLRLAGLERVVEDFSNRQPQVISGEEAAAGVEQIPVRGVRGIYLHTLETGVGPQAVEI